MNFLNRLEKYSKYVPLRVYFSSFETIKKFERDRQVIEKKIHIKHNNNNIRKQKYSYIDEEELHVKKNKNKRTKKHKDGAKQEEKNT